MIELGLIVACTNGVAPATVQAVIQVESAGNNWAVGAKAALGRLPAPADRHQARQLSEALIAAGHRVDMGLMQVNSVHLKRFGLTPDDLFDSCTNLFVGTTILAEFYRRAVRAGATRQEALRAALSAYNTGSFVKGIHNGYVRKVEAYAGVHQSGSDVDAAVSPLRVRFKVERHANGAGRSDRERGGDGDAGAGRRAGSDRTGQ